MPINSDEIKFFDYAANLPEIKALPNPLNIMALRKVFLSNGLIDACGDYADVSITKTHIPTRDGYNIPVRIFNNDLTEKSPALVMYPGNGYILDAFEISAIVFSRIAKMSGIKIIMPEPRLAPEHPVTTIINDAYDLGKYVITHSSQFNIDSSKFFLGGFSSGAHSAAVVANLARHDPNFKIHHLILFSGMYDATQSNTNYDKYTIEDKWTTKEGSRFMMNNWGINSSEYKNPIISPVYEKNLSNLPNITIICGEYDGLRNHTEEYYLKLKQAGNKCTKIVLAGQTHTTIAYRKIINGDDPANTIAQVIKSNL